MALARNAAEEFSEELLYGISYTYLFPQVRAFIDAQFPDEVDPITKKTTPNIMKEAVESSINVIMMGILFMIMRYQEAFLERLFVLSRSSMVFVMAGGKNFLIGLKNRIKGKRGIGAINRMKKYGDSMDTRVQMANNIQMQTDSIINARASQYTSTSVYSPAAQMADSNIQKERLHHEVGASKIDAKMKLATYKLFTGTFTEADKQTLKILFKSVDPTAAYNPATVDIAQLNKISEFMFVTDSNGKIKGLSSAFIDIVNGLGYIHKSNSGGN